MVNLPQHQPRSGRRPWRNPSPSFFEFWRKASSATSRWTGSFIRPAHGPFNTKPNPEQVDFPERNKNITKINHWGWGIAIASCRCAVAVAPLPTPASSSDGAGSRLLHAAAAAVAHPFPFSDPVLLIPGTTRLLLWYSIKGTAWRWGFSWSREGDALVC
jgi:hypothetical protein